MNFTNASCWVHLKGVEFYAYHGVLTEETTLGNRFVVDVSVEQDFTRAFASDAVADTLNYASLYQIVEQEMAKPSLLLEHVLGRIADAIHNAFPQAKRCKLEITKSVPPIATIMRGASVSATIDF